MAGIPLWSSSHMSGMNSPVNQWDLVIKVKHVDILRRFMVHVSGNSLDHNMNDLRMKITKLFKFSLDVDFILTYTDADGDLVTLIDDDELRDAAIHQHLNPLRLNVQLNGKPAGQSVMKPAGQSDSQSSSSNVGTQAAQMSIAVDEALRSVPEPLRNAFSNLSQDFLSKAVASAPAVGELLEYFSKLCDPHASPSHVPSGGVSVGGSSAHHQASADVISEPAVFSSANSVDPNNNKQPEPNKTSQGAGISSPIFDVPTVSQSSGSTHIEELLTCIGRTNARAAKQKEDGGQQNGKSGANTSSLHVPLVVKEQNLEMNKASASATSMPGPAAVLSEGSDKQIPVSLNTRSQVDCDDGNGFVTSRHIGAPSPKESPPDYIYLPGYCPRRSDVSRAGAPFPDVFRVFPPGFNSRRSDGSHRIFHRGVHCDGCGMHPIMGPRYKSNVREDYDLCGICFSEIGNEADYTRIDRVLHRSPRSREPSGRNSRQHACRDYRLGPAKAKLESWFIQDVTILDGTLMPPSTQFTKIWKMSNNGSTPWPMGTQLVCTGGDRFANRSSVELEIPVTGFPVGEEIDIAVDFKAPSRSGTYISYWRLSSISGQFGQRVWVSIQVANQGSDSAPSVLHPEFNLNLPPASNGWSRIIDMNVEPEGEVRHYEPSFLDTDVEPVNPLTGEISQPVRVDGQPVDNSGFTKVVPKKDPPFSYPIIDPPPVSSDASRGKAPIASYPIIDTSPVSSNAPPEMAPSASHGSIDPTSVLPTAPPTAVDPPYGDADDNMAEQAFLKELEEMGFQQVDLNREILRLNEYDLERSLNDLCGVADWDPLLVELEEMGFCDKEMNRKLLIKNGGSIKRVVLDLIAGEK